LEADLAVPFTEFIGTLALLQTKEAIMSEPQNSRATCCPKAAWNKGKLVGAKPPLQPKHVWAIRARLQLDGRRRDSILFNLALDSKLRACDLVRLRVEDIAPLGYAVQRASIQQRKTGRPVRFEITEHSRDAVDAYLAAAGSRIGPWLFPGRGGRPLTTRQYARLLDNWLSEIGLEPALFGTHSLGRTKATLIYRRTGNIRPLSPYLVIAKSGAPSGT
jgi:integrase